MSDKQNNQFSETFKQEAEELLTDIEECILNIENNPQDKDAINKLFRAMHTIKGSGSMFGFEDIAKFTHHVETCLDKVRDGEVPISKELIDLILASRDQIKAMLDGDSYDIETNDSIIAALNYLMQNPAQDHSVNHKNNQPVGGPGEYLINFNAPLCIFSSGMDPAVLIEELRELGECTVELNTDNIPTITEIDPENCYFSWKINIITEKDLATLKDVFIFIESDCEITIEPVEKSSDCSDCKEQPEFDPDKPDPKIGDILIEHNVINNQTLGIALDKQKETKKRVGEILVGELNVDEKEIENALKEQSLIKEKTNSARQESVRVPSEKLDQLINLVGELVITQAQLSQLCSSHEIADLTKPVEEVERLTGELRDSVLNIRMMPIGTQFNRFKRLVRDMSKELNKEIELETKGAETEMDKTVIERLGDPLIHLIRNSLDHGIEEPDIRTAAGKPRTGTITLSAEHKGASVMITIHDDGKGLNKQAIVNKAVSKGLISPDADLSDKEIFNLILMPGFSTAEQVTSISGRGVGMDVVKREIENLRGTVDLSSVEGKGTTIRLNLPLTLAIIDGLLVDIDGDNYVIPVSLVEECIEMNDMINAMSKDRNLIQVRGELVPYIRLRDIFNIPGVATEIEEAVIVNLNNTRLGIVVDHIIGDHQTVIKSLGKLYKDITEISGATIMGNGNVALILDVAGIMETAKREENLAYV